jgi:hypothetical protein
MCDLTTINNAMIGIDEPNGLFWSGVNCSGMQLSLPEGDYSTLAGKRVGNDAVSGLWVPPNMELDVFDNVNFQTPLGTYKPGLLYADLNNPNMGAGRNQIASLKLRRTKTWHDHLANCCTGKVANGATPETCGQWWGKGAAANGVCDDIMETYCSPTGPNVDSPKCSCYSVPSSSNDSIDVKLLKSQPKCWSETCSTKGYLPSNMTNSTCPNVKICKQEFSIPGSQNIMTDNKYIQDCSETIAVPVVTTGGQVLPPPSAGTPASTANTGDSVPAASSSPSMLVYLFIFIAFIVVGSVMFGKSEQRTDMNTGVNQQVVQASTSTLQQV